MKYSTWCDNIEDRRESGTKLREYIASKLSDKGVEFKNGRLSAKKALTNKPKTVILPNPSNTLDEFF